jgi:SAM-dependent methyltransferase
LDIACGSGYGAVVLAAGEYVGLDVDDACVAEAKAHHGDLGTFAVYDGVDVPYPDETFDTVVSLETIEHLTQDTQAHFLEELARVCRRGGKLVLSTPNRQHVQKRIKQRLTGWNNPFHEYEFETRELLSFVAGRKNALEIEEVHYLGLPMHLGNRMVERICGIVRVPFERVARFDFRGGQLMPRWCNSVLVVARRK